jgi:hypothetical protein
MSNSFRGTTLLGLPNGKPAFAEDQHPPRP